MKDSKNGNGCAADAGEAREPNPYVNVSPVERCISALTGGALIVQGARQGGWKGACMALLGAPMVYWGATGHCSLYGATGMNTARSFHGVRVEDEVQIDSPPEAVYAYWRDFENLPQIMEHLQSVTVTGDGTSHWVTEGPAGRLVEWDAEVINEVRNEVIAWRSLSGSDITTVGSVNFYPLKDGNATLLKVVLEYDPPAGALGAAVAKLFGEDPAKQLADDLCRFKTSMEAGELTKPRRKASSGSRSRKAASQQAAA
jgi:uncharacterized membrane protein